MCNKDKPIIEERKGFFDLFCSRCAYRSVHYFKEPCSTCSISKSNFRLSKKLVPEPEPEPLEDRQEQVEKRLQALEDRFEDRCQGLENRVKTLEEYLDKRKNDRYCDDCKHADLLPTVFPCSVCSVPDDYFEYRESEDA